MMTRQQETEYKNLWAKRKREEQNRTKINDFKDNIRQILKNPKNSPEIKLNLIYSLLDD